jgi:hypothetical protein
MTHTSGQGNAAHPAWMLRGRRAIATITMFAVLTAGSILGQSDSPAFAADYPSWDDVQAARQSQSATQAEVTRVQGLLAGLQAAADSTQAVAVQKGDEYQAAQQKYDEAAFKAAELQKQADAAQLKAAKSKQQAGQLAARLSRSAETTSQLDCFSAAEIRRRTWPSSGSRAWSRTSPLASTRKPSRTRTPRSR